MAEYERQANRLPGTPATDDTPQTRNPLALRLKDLRETMRDYEVNDIYLIELQAIMNGLAYYSRGDVKPDSIYIKLTERLSILVSTMTKDSGKSVSIMDRLAKIIEEEEGDD